MTRETTHYVEGLSKMDRSFPRYSAACGRDVRKQHVTELEFNANCKDCQKAIIKRDSAAHSLLDNIVRTDTAQSKPQYLRNLAIFEESLKSNP